jgi:predicted nucleotidyltransferase
MINKRKQHTSGNGHLPRLQRDVVAELRKLYGQKIVKVLLFGSYARNEATPESDFDVFVLVDMREPQLKKLKHRIAEIMTDLSVRHNVLVAIMEKDYHTYLDRLDILPFYRNVEKDGVELYGRKTA